MRIHFLTRLIEAMRRPEREKPPAWLGDRGKQAWRLSRLGVITQNEMIGIIRREEGLPPLNEADRIFRRLERL